MFVFTFSTLVTKKQFTFLFEHKSEKILFFVATIKNIQSDFLIEKQQHFRDQSGRFESKKEKCVFLHNFFVIFVF